MKPQYQEINTKMEKTRQALINEFASIRASTASVSVLDKISVDYWGVKTPINQVATVSVQEGKTLLIQPYDASLLKTIEKAIQVSDLGINPQNDGRIIRLAFPPLTEERRKDIVKDIRKMCENSKVAIRSIRRDALETFKAQKKKSEITEDDLKSAEKDVQDMTDKFCKEIDTLSAAKEKEILSV